MTAIRRGLGAVVAVVIGLGAGPMMGTDPGHAETTTQGDLLILLDASGSMAEPDGSKTRQTKMAAARKAVHGVVDVLPDNARVGVRAYGPPATGSGCRASKLLHPIGTLDRDAVTTKVDGLKEGGDTPIAYSLERAAKDFSGDRPRTILLISDGEESCGGDPVAVAKKITDQGVNVRIDVVGFRVDAKARDQLAKVAQAGQGQYVDAQDGAALFSRLKRAGSHAMRGYKAVGTPVTGSADGLNPPLLKPGQYRDVMPPNHGEEKPSRYYAFDLPKGARAYLAVTVPWSTSMGSNARNSLGFTVRTAAEKYCVYGSGSEYYLGGGSVTATAQEQLAYDPKAETGECGAPGRYVFEVDNSGMKYRTGTVPMELVLVVEPTAKPAGLPGPYTEEKEAVAPAVSGPAKSTTGAGSFGEAPVLGTGVYGDTLRPGEEIFYRVPVNWGQRLSYQISLPKQDAAGMARLDGSGVLVQTAIYNPVRAEATQQGYEEIGYYSGRAESTHGSIVPVRYRNRESKDNSTAATSLPGYYYIGLRMNANLKDPYFELPITLAVEVSGKPSGGPSYQDPTGLGSPDEQLAVKLAATDDRKDPRGGGGGMLPVSLLWVGAGLGGLLLLGGGGTAFALLRRR